MAENEDGIGFDAGRFKKTKQTNLKTTHEATLRQYYFLMMIQKFISVA